MLRDWSEQDVCVLAASLGHYADAVAVAVVATLPSLPRSGDSSPVAKLQDQRPLLAEGGVVNNDDPLLQEPPTGNEWQRSRQHDAPAGGTGGTADRG